jgi:hypothetical protein
MEQQTLDQELFREWLGHFYSFITDTRIPLNYASPEMWETEPQRAQLLVGAEVVAYYCRVLNLNLEDRVIPAGRRLGFSAVTLETVQERLKNLQAVLALPFICSERSSGEFEWVEQPSASEGWKLVAEAIDLCRDSYRELEAVLSGKPPSKEKSGLRGRPTARHLIVQEFKRMVRDRELTSGDTQAGVAIRLRRWQQKEHPDTRILSAETIRKRIRPIWKSRFKT